jgi:hypothetical protein
MLTIEKLIGSIAEYHGGSGTFIPYYFLEMQDPA